jgi:opacity protein-like surface antigen
MAYSSACRVAALAALVVAGAPAGAQDWSGTFTLSGWVPTVSGTEGADGGPRVELDTRDRLGGGALAPSATAALRRGPLGLLFELTYADLDADGEVAAPAAGRAEVGTRLLIASAAASWRFHDAAGSYAEAFGGLRGFDVEVDVDDAGTGSRSASARWVDPILGLRGALDFAERWSLSGLGDIGGFSAGSDLNYQVYGGLSYAFSEKLLATIGYRYMKIDYDDERLDIDVDIEGPVIGLTYNF